MCRFERRGAVLVDHGVDESSVPLPDQLSAPQAWRSNGCWNLWCAVRDRGVPFLSEVGGQPKTAPTVNALATITAMMTAVSYCPH